MWPCWRSPCSWPGADTGICRSGDRQCVAASPSLRRPVRQLSLSLGGTASQRGCGRGTGPMRSPTSAPSSRPRARLRVDQARRRSRFERGADGCGHRLRCRQGGGRRVHAVEPGDADPLASRSMGWTGRATRYRARRTRTSLSTVRQHANQPVPIDCDGECSGPRGDPRVRAYRVNPRVPGSSPGWGPKRQSRTWRRARLLRFGSRRR